MRSPSELAQQLAELARLLAVGTDVETAVIVRNRETQETVVSCSEPTFGPLLRCVDSGSYLAHMRYCEVVYRVAPQEFAQAHHRSETYGGAAGDAYHQAVVAVEQMVALGFPDKIATLLLGQLTHAYFALRRNEIATDITVN